MKLLKVLKNYNMENNFAEIRLDKIQYVFVYTPEKLDIEFRNSKPPKKYFFGLLTDYKSGEPGGWYHTGYPISEEILNNDYVKKSDGWYSKYKVIVYFSNKNYVHEYYNTKQEVEEVLNKLKDKPVNYTRL
jgi:hypothetical protein